MTDVLLLLCPAPRSARLERFNMFWQKEPLTLTADSTLQVGSGEAPGRAAPEAHMYHLCALSCSCLPPCALVPPLPPSHI